MMKSKLGSKNNILKVYKVYKMQFKEKKIKVFKIYPNFESSIII